MTFNQGGSFEGGRVRTSRGGRGAAIGGGIGGLGLLVVVVISLMTGADPSQLLGASGGSGGGEQGEVGACTAEQANSDPQCRLSATVQALDAYWATALPSGFAEPGVESFTGGTSTGCGQASSSTGPFYCPPDQSIYLDLAFYDVLQSQYGASGGPLAEMYVTAHEYGHHVQNLTGVMASADRQGGGAESDSVRVELQADCYAGLWAGHASSTVDPDTGVVFLEPISADELAQALSAAAAVGDDHLQAQSSGGVNPDTWTHGSSEQRQRWFTTGYERGDISACDTFAAAQL
ncbi:KPN_02809 family neutral zinc metallopeptidase [Cellulomonas timonensis]|uniref:KPN_02809 family neutral zinc metallopeptidase n=1 Tax=Cellulomonas timonensis TaxID=1689271 RepID=UPI000834E1D0|nr:neutral zinc metallopeptidase [Cellulomonas timonensis]